MVGGGGYIGIKVMAECFRRGLWQGLATISELYVTSGGVPTGRRWIRCYNRRGFSKRS